MQTPIRATIAFAPFAERPHEFRQVTTSCVLGADGAWACEQGQATRRVFSRRPSESIAVPGDIALRDALAVLEFAQTFPAWREIDPERTSLRREGAVFVLQELEAELRIELRNGVPRLISAERLLL